MEEKAAQDHQNTQPHYIGHRQRLRERFLKDEGRSMPDYELLELLLTIAIPRRDVKPLAKSLIERFKSFAGTINASITELKKYGLTENTIIVLKIISAAMIKLSWQQLSERDEPILSQYDEMVNYCRAAVAYKPEEEFHVLCLNSSLKIIKDEIIQRGTVDSIVVYPREVVKTALDCGAMSVVLYQNQPTGECQPLKSDITTNDQIVEALRPLKIKVYDHLIFSKENLFSFRESGLIK